ncbi:hypothetical protein B0H14DRAFT_3492902 [Mycena olivaceomarginata]|nr:hypothetical protein B0H14DRAFT_3492902 [Mycena olivaceomarginata]
MPMARSAMFCEIPLSTSIDPLSANSLVSLDWILSSGIPAHQSVASGVLTVASTDTVYSMPLKVSVVADLHSYTMDIVPHLADVNVLSPQPPARRCVCDEPLVCRCPSTSVFLPVYCTFGYYDFVQSLA